MLHADIPGVKPEDIEVTMENGVLEVIIPKHERVMPRRISVNVN